MQYSFLENNEDAIYVIEDAQRSIVKTNKGESGGKGAGVLRARGHTFFQKKGGEWGRRFLGTDKPRSGT